MKKVIAILIALSIVALSVTAFAEVMQADGSPLVLEGFTLNLDKGVVYQLVEKDSTKVYVTVYPFYHVNGDSSTNFNAVWDTSNITMEDIENQISDIKAAIEEGFKPYGITLNYIEYADPYGYILSGEPCIGLDNQMSIDADGKTLEFYQRQIFTFDRNYTFTISAIDQDTLESAYSVLNDVLTWE